jgi:endonuclease YncB( thermonuclease family)
LKPHAIDRYGRLVAMVYVEDAGAGLEMLKAGDGLALLPLFG